jgi:hypothetical protein
MPFQLPRRLRTVTKMSGQDSRSPRRNFQTLSSKQADRQVIAFSYPTQLRTRTDYILQHLEMPCQFVMLGICNFRSGNGKKVKLSLGLTN